MHAAIVGLVVSASIVFFATFGADRRSRDQGPVDERIEGSDEAVAPKQEPAAFPERPVIRPSGEHGWSGQKYDRD